MAELKKAEQPASIATLLQQPAMLQQLKMALPKHITPERLSRIVLTQLRRDPKLLQCSRESLLGSIMEAAQLGLEPGVNGQCWLVAYNDKRRGMIAQLIIGYRGMAQLAWRSGMVSSMSTRVVYEGDHFHFDYGSDKLEHVPAGNTDPAAITHAYAVIHTTMGGRIWEVMSRAEIEAIRTRSRAGQSGPWMTDYAEMCKKTAFRRLAKLAPASAEMSRAMELDEAVDTGGDQEFTFDLGTIDVEPVAGGPAVDGGEHGREGERPVGA